MIIIKTPRGRARLLESGEWRADDDELEEIVRALAEMFEYPGYLPDRLRAEARWVAEQLGGEIVEVRNHAQDDDDGLDPVTDLPKVYGAR